jgi:2-polyprenyl-6-hydroxyphenyl methylase/3-demethylubiquinone-9 3-methyltransferase
MLPKIVQFFRLKVFRINKHRWNYQYEKGMWDGLRDKEMERINVAKDMVERFVRGGKILEIGCGEGIFFQNIPEEQYSFFEGIDISSIAIEKVEQTAKSLFIVADMENYIPSQSTFAVIVFNEVIYYAKNPVLLLNRYTHYLDQKGILLIGMYQSAKSDTIWEQIEKHYNILESKEIHQDGKTWMYKVIQQLQ